MVSENGAPNRKDAELSKNEIKKEQNTNSESKSSSTPQDPPPFVRAISNLRCPSPPPILNNSNNNNATKKAASSSPILGNSMSMSTPNITQQRETIPAGGAVLKEKEKVANQSATSIIPPQGHEPSFNVPLVREPGSSVNFNHYISPISSPAGSHVTGSNNSLTSLDYVSNPPSQSAHHKVPSVHAHFYVDETVKPGKAINRSRSSSASDYPPASLPANGTRKSSKKEKGNDLNLFAPPSIDSVLGPNEQNSNIDPRLPQDDGKLHVLLGVCGALSTIKIKLIINKLVEIYTPDKISIQIILTKSSENFIPQEMLHHLENNKRIRVWRDSDEWNTWKTRLDPVLHIELRRWADILIVSPLTANTLSKISLGLCDNLLTNVIRAWNTSFPILLAPSMVSASYNAVTTKRQLRLISEEMPWIEFLKPVEKVVGSYGEIGMGGMMDWNEIVNRIVLKLGGYPDEEDEEDNEAEDEEKKDDNEEAIMDDDDDDDDDDDFNDDDSAWDSVDDESDSESFDERSFVRTESSTKPALVRPSLLSSLFLNKPERLMEEQAAAKDKSHDDKKPSPAVQPSPLAAAKYSKSTTHLANSRAGNDENGEGNFGILMSPRTTRRNMLASELSESVRRDLLRERKQLSHLVKPASSSDTSNGDTNPTLRNSAAGDIGDAEESDLIKKATAFGKAKLQRRSTTSAISATSSSQESWREDLEEDIKGDFNYHARGW